MNVIRRRGWEMPESRATPEHVFLNRRAFLGAAAGAAAIGFVARACAGATRRRSARSHRRSLSGQAQREVRARPAAHRREGQRQLQQFLRVRLQQEHRQGGAGAEDPPVDHQDRRHGGKAVRDRHRRPDPQGRHRGAALSHRCVEAWSMAIPWSGFPMAKLVELAKPLSSAKYVRMETFLDKSIAPGQRQTWFPWPYVEGVTIAEATNELAFLVTGAYGKPTPKQHGAPIRLALPWKYGFKSIKSIVRVQLHRQAAEELLGRPAVVRVRLLGQRQSGGVASALEPGDRGNARHRRRAQADAAVQRLRRICRRALQGAGERTALGVARRRRKKIPNAAVRPRFLFHRGFEK